MAKESSKTSADSQAWRRRLQGTLFVGGSSVNSRLGCHPSAMAARLARLTLFSGPKCSLCDIAKAELVKAKQLASGMAASDGQKII